MACKGGKKKKIYIIQKITMYRSIKNENKIKLAPTKQTVFSLLSHLYLGLLLNDVHADREMQNHNDYHDNAHDHAVDCHETGDSRGTATVLGPGQVAAATTKSSIQGKCTCIYTAAI
jgi:hypothetical protein